MSYYFSKVVDDNFDEAIERVTARLADAGFGVLTTIDVSATLKKKIDVDFQRYTILGACNPGFAYKTLQIEENIGVFLPCKAIVKDIGEGKIEVVVVNPAALMGMLNKPELVSIANEVSDKFQKALEKL